MLLCVSTPLSISLTKATVAVSLPQIALTLLKIVLTSEEPIAVPTNFLESSGPKFTPKLSSC